MTPGRSNRIQMTSYSFQHLQITRADIRPQVKWAVNLVSADGHF